MQLDILLTEEQIAVRVRELARELALKLQDREAGVVIVGPLKGCLMIAADLARAFHAEGVRVELDFMGLSSYGAGTESSGEVVLTSPLRMDLAGRQVVLVDDIADTGRTLAKARALIEERRPSQILTAVALDKPSRRVVHVALDAVGFEIPDLFVLGYGADLAERHRELPFVGVKRS
jgi:hypoxanthine phosphoribosyltransferase